MISCGLIFNQKIMKNVMMIAAVAGLTLFTACNKDAKTEAVATDVQNVTGENVADAQKDLNESVVEAQEAVNAAQKELDDATAKGDQVLMGAAQTKLNELQATLDMVKKNAGESIRATNGQMDGADKQLDNTTDAAESKLDNVEDQADKLKNKVN